MEKVQSALKSRRKQATPHAFRELGRNSIGISHDISERILEDYEGNLIIDG